MYPSPAHGAPLDAGIHRGVLLLLLLSFHTLFLAGAGCEASSPETVPLVADQGEERGPEGASVPGRATHPPGGIQGSVRSSPEVPSSSLPDLPGAQLCPGAGYLCHGLLEGWPGAGADPPRIGRWPDDTGTLIVALPPPPMSDPVRGAALHRSAIRGILAWDRHPFPIRVLDREVDTGPPAHITVRWTPRLGPGEAGRVRSGWTVRGDAFRFEVTDFVLALEVAPPGAPTPFSLDPDEVERVAAHEMGHALGLGHSDHPGDLMYPTNTARALSPRDYRTLEALYRLPPGARLIPPPG